MSPDAAPSFARSARALFRLGRHPGRPVEEDRALRAALNKALQLCGRQDDAAQAALHEAVDLFVQHRLAPTDVELVPHFFRLAHRWHDEDCLARLRPPLAEWVAVVRTDMPHEEDLLCRSEANALLHAQNTGHSVHERLETWMTRWGSHPPVHGTDILEAMKPLAKACNRQDWLGALTLGLQALAVHKALSKSLPAEDQMILGARERPVALCLTADGADAAPAVIDGVARELASLPGPRSVRLNATHFADLKTAATRFAAVVPGAEIHLRLEQVPEDPEALMAMAAGAASLCLVATDPLSPALLSPALVAALDALDQAQQAGDFAPLVMVELPADAEPAQRANIHEHRPSITILAIHRDAPDGPAPARACAAWAGLRLDREGRPTLCARHPDHLLAATGVTGRPLLTVWQDTPLAGLRHALATRQAAEAPAPCQTCPVVAPLPCGPD